MLSNLLSRAIFTFYYLLHYLTLFVNTAEYKFILIVVFLNRTIYYYYLKCCYLQTDDQEEILVMEDGPPPRLNRQHSDGFQHHQHSQLRARLDIQVGLVFWL